MSDLLINLLTILFSVAGGLLILALASTIVGFGLITGRLEGYKRFAQRNGLNPNPEGHNPMNRTNHGK